MIHKEKHQEEIDNLDINSLAVNNLDNRKTWIIIWQIREKIFNIYENNKEINIKDKNITDIIDILKLPLHIEKEFETISELINYIISLKFINIEDFFLNNEIQKEDFLKWAKLFLTKIK